MTLFELYKHNKISNAITFSKTLFEPNRTQFHSEFNLKSKMENRGYQAYKDCEMTKIPDNTYKEEVLVFENMTNGCIPKYFGEVSYGNGYYESIFIS